MENRMGRTGMLLAVFFFRFFFKSKLESCPQTEWSVVVSKNSFREQNNIVLKTQRFLTEKKKKNSLTA